MLELIPTFDLKKDVLPFILEKRSSYGFSDGDIPDVQVVGQEQDGSLLYAWTDLTPYLPDTEVVHVGIYDPVTKSNKVVFIHDKNVRFVNATINQEQTFLGFVVAEENLISDRYGKQQSNAVYKAYLAEIQPQGRVFYLNLERSNYLQLQFLYGQYKSQNFPRESHLLVLLHKESIGLYHIPVARCGDKGVIMSGEPKKEQIFNRRFIWSQWDAAYQRLHVAHFKKQGKTLNGQTVYKPMLTSYQFDVNTINELLIDIPLDLPLPFVKNTFASTYLNLGPSTCMPENAVNMAVLSQPNGTYCVCFQHPIMEGPGYLVSQARISAWKSTKTRSAYRVRRILEPTEKLTEVADLVSPRYSICLVHHEKVLHCITPKVPVSFLANSRIYFSWLNEYLLVYLPGCFTHLLNVGIEYEPVHHLLYHENTNQEFHDNPIGKDAQFFVNYVRDKNLVAVGSGFGLFDCQKQQGFKLSLATDTLKKMFETGSMTARLAILHHAVIHAKDLMLTRSLLDTLANDVLSPDVMSLFEEFLISSTYSALRKQMDRHLLKYIAFTNCETTRGLMEKCYQEDNKKLCSLSYSNLGEVLLGDKRLGHHGEDLLENLRHHLNSKVEDCRFTTKEVVHYLYVKGPKAAKEMPELDLPNTTSAQSTSASTSTSSSSSSEQKLGFFKRITTQARSAFTSVGGKSDPNNSSCSGNDGPRPPSRIEQILGPTPFFFSSNSDRVDYHHEAIPYLTQNSLIEHLLRKMMREPRVKTQNIALQYTMAQLQQSHLLCHVIWSIFGPAESSTAVPLSQPSNEDDYKLFIALERYVHAMHRVAYPLPSGFMSYFTRLAFRSLQFHVFQQYIQSQVVRVTPEFARACLRDLDDEEDNVNIKLNVLSLLPQRDAIDCAVSWDHPLCNQMVARSYTTANLVDENFSGWLWIPGKEGGHRKFSTSQFATNFPSLDALVQLLKQRDAFLGYEDRGIDEHYISDAAVVNFIES